MSGNDVDGKMAAVSRSMDAAGSFVWTVFQLAGVMAGDSFARSGSVPANQIAVAGTTVN
jgi:hypothetical protein